MTKIDAIPWNADADKAWEGWERSDYEPPADPRPDIFVDHDQWVLLLAAAYRLNDYDIACSAFWSLKYARELGAMLHIEGGKARVRRGMMTEDDYAKVREELLLPVIEKLRPLLEDPTGWWQ